MANMTDTLAGSKAYPFYIKEVVMENDPTKLCRPSLKIIVKLDKQKIIERLLDHEAFIEHSNINMIKDDINDIDVIVDGEKYTVTVKKIAKFDGFKIEKRKD